MCYAHLNMSHFVFWRLPLNHSRKSYGKGDMKSPFSTLTSFHLCQFASQPIHWSDAQLFQHLKSKISPNFRKYFYSGVEIRIITFTQAIRHEDSTRYLSTSNAIEVTTSILRTKWTLVMWPEKPSFYPELLWDHAPTC